MRKNLFISGPIGCGKTTALTAALEPFLPDAGGFLTLRRRDPQGEAADFVLTAPDSRKQTVFLDLTGGEPRWYPEVFRELGTSLLKESLHRPFAVLDEIGGRELLEPEFREALITLLKSDVPCIGVLKAECSAAQLADTLGQDTEYDRQLRQLHRFLSQDPDTCLLYCTTGCELAAILAKKWAQEYCQ